MDKSTHTTPKKNTFVGWLIGVFVKTLFTFALGLLAGLWLCGFQFREDLPTLQELMDRASITIGHGTEAHADATPAASETASAGILVNRASLADTIGTSSERLTDVVSDIITGSVMDCRTRDAGLTEEGERLALCMSPILWAKPETTPHPFRGWCDASMGASCIRAARVILAKDGTVVFPKVYVFLTNSGRPYFEGPDGVKLADAIRQKQVFFQMYDEHVESK